MISTNRMVIIIYTFLFGVSESWTSKFYLFPQWLWGVQHLHPHMSFLTTHHITSFIPWPSSHQSQYKNGPLEWVKVLKWWFLSNILWKRGLVEPNLHFLPRNWSPQDQGKSKGWTPLKPIMFQKHWEHKAEFHQYAKSVCYLEAWGHG